jgi:hypothetical protein
MEIGEGAAGGDREREVNRWCRRGWVGDEVVFSFAPCAFYIYILVHKTTMSSYCNS